MDNYEKWMNGVVLSRRKVILLGYVRSLGHCRSWNIGIVDRMGEIARNSGEYLSGLRNLRKLAFFSIKVEHIGEDQFHN